ncbi:MAG: SDR family oxidoreductase [Pseudomonadota bacterium]
MKVFVVGATGLMGGQVVTELLKLGDEVHALVRAPQKAQSLKDRGVILHKGDLKDPSSLKLALDQLSGPFDALVTTAYGYSRRQKGDSLESVDDVGNRNLIEAAKAARVGRFVFTSILTADKAVSVPHFHQKARTEAVLEASGLEWVALRPGGFLDTLLGMNEASLKKGKLSMPADLEAPATTILTEDVARCLALATRVQGIEGERIDLGMQAPTNIVEIARCLSRALGYHITAERPPALVTSVLFGIMGLFNSTMKDNIKAMEYVSTGQYIADVTRQTQVFGPPRTIEESVNRWAATNRHLFEKAA